MSLSSTDSLSHLGARDTSPLPNPQRVFFFFWQLLFLEGSWKMPPSVLTLSGRCVWSVRAKAAAGVEGSWVPPCWASPRGLHAPTLPDRTRESMRQGGALLWASMTALENLEGASQTQEW